MSKHCANCLTENKVPKDRASRVGPGSGEGSLPSGGRDNERKSGRPGSVYTQTSGTNSGESLQAEGGKLVKAKAPAPVFADLDLSSLPKIPALDAYNDAQSKLIASLPTEMRMIRGEMRPVSIVSKENEKAFDNKFRNQLNSRNNPEIMEGKKAYLQALGEIVKGKFPELSQTLKGPLKPFEITHFFRQLYGREGTINTANLAMLGSPGGVAKSINFITAKQPEIESENAKIAERLKKKGISEAPEFPETTEFRAVTPPPPTGPLSIMMQQLQPKPKKPSIEAKDRGNGVEKMAG